jgi:sn-glycerol 3-phosphate transport system ATP-binding protein
MAKVDFRDVKKSFGTLSVIHGISVDVKDGEFVVIVGPSGCGKSTLLRMVAGLETITSGEIAIGERVVNGLEPKDRDIAMVFQNYALYPHMSVFDNMAYGLKIRGLSKADVAERVKRAAAILELESLLERKPRQLSGGQRQRVAMGRAIVREPAVFLFDEPLSNLDAKLRVQMRFEIQKLHRRLGTTALYVTHDQVEAMTLAQRMIVMNAGRAEQIGTPMEVYENPATQFVAGFIGSPSMNFVAGRVEGGGRVVLNDGGVAVTASGAGAQPGRDVVVGIRPEHLVPAGAGEAVLSGAVEMVEQLGADMLIHVAHGPHLFLARVPHGALPDVGSTMHFRASPASVFLFDAAHGGRLA